MIWAQNEHIPFVQQTTELEQLWHDILNTARITEELAIVPLLEKPIYNTPTQLNHIKEHARNLIESIRDVKLKSLSIESFLKTHNLSSQEGIALMCLSEALLRIPDASTKTQLIRDKVGAGSWQNKDQDPLLTKFAHIGLIGTSKFLAMGNQKSPLSVVASLIRRFGEPLIRQIMAQSVRIIAQQFVMGETIEKAIDRAQEVESKGYRYSYDMLGESAKTMVDADRYFQNYKAACIDIGTRAIQTESIFEKPSLSVKLSALHPRYEMAKRARVLTELTPRILELAQLAKTQNIGLTLDAEESERLTLSLEIFHNVYNDPALDQWEGLGLAIQAYQKRASYVARWLIALARHRKRRIIVRLVKGAYWDSEIKRTQVNGLSDYSVFTQKHHTDTSYLAVGKMLLQATDAIYPQFATHNAFTVSAITSIAANDNITDFEFQRLHGMGEALYEQVTEHTDAHIQRPGRIYAPVGNYRDLLAYLVRRLLENGANSSFVHQIHDHTHSIEQLIDDPVQKTINDGGKKHPNIPLPAHIYKESRENSAGIDLHSELELASLNQFIHPTFDSHSDTPLTDNGTLHRIVDISHSHTESWAKTTVEERARIIYHLGDLIQQSTPALLNALVHEAGKTLPDAIGEIREAVDFCYYYAANALKLQATPTQLPSPTGELNLFSYHPRGVFVSISPWNFPLAIFIGQLSAALVTGNCVIAKSAMQTHTIAKIAIDIAYAAGVPAGVLQLVHTSGQNVSDVILTHPSISGVVFTGSTETARQINQTLANRAGAILPLIAETGGINAMIVDSSALAEQVVPDIITSAFQSAGQRCSALRLLCLQEDIADSILDMLMGAIDELKIGIPYELSTDIGAVIDTHAQKSLLAYCESLINQPERARLLYKYDVAKIQTSTTHPFVPPHIFQVGRVSDVTHEVFGPILHVVRYRGEYLDQVIKDINALGYGLTLGLHTRLESTMQMVANRINAGNMYVNRSMIGAVVGVQPFGGEGMSGTGFKAGGQNYLLKFVHERVYTQDTTAAGGNASLLTSL